MAGRLPHIEPDEHLRRVSLRAERAETVAAAEEGASATAGLLGWGLLAAGIAAAYRTIQRYRGRT